MAEIPKPERRERARKWLGRNYARAARRHEEAFGVKAFWIREFCRCAVTGVRRNIVAAHTVARSRHGKSEHLIPLSWAIHEMQHRIGWETFEREYLHGQDRHKLAAKYEQSWQEFAEAKGLLGVTARDVNEFGSLRQYLWAKRKEN